LQLGTEPLLAFLSELSLLITQPRHSLAQVGENP
jgi:hypothetical protein